MEKKQTNPKDAIGSTKSPVSNIPTNVLAEVGLALLEGEIKYTRYNWREAGARASIYYDALFRHFCLRWWNEHEELDPESGVHHISKAIACLIILRDAQMNGVLVDDRPPKSEQFSDLFNEQSKDIIEKYKKNEPEEEFSLAKIDEIMAGFNPPKK